MVRGHAVGCIIIVTACTSARHADTDLKPSRVTTAEDATMLTITAADAAKHGLPAIGMNIDPTSTAMSVYPLDQPGQYIVASGPPGGTLMFEVWTTDERGNDGAAIRRAVESRFTAPGMVPKVWGPEGTLTLVGRAWPAVAFLTDEGMFQTGWCAALVEHPSGSLLITMGCGVGAAATTTSCDEIASHPSLMKLVRTFSLVSG